ncbi:MAG TPA: glycoside hydrolase family 2 TIM barrel-domain containing protein, partial [Balneolaceae bacterium]|nr:glycoside hydrolase family 2 TIM barrel-domain containing protein [Balneolaceae bacterium]
MKRYLLFLLFIIIGIRSIKAQSSYQLKDFKLQSSAVIKQDGTTLSTAKYQADNYWFPVTIPSTVLSGLVANDVYPSPYFGMNNMRIPDASDSTNEAYNLSRYSYLPNQKNPWKDPYWYRTSFRLPKNDRGKRIFLNFKGINYRAAVWINGHQLADSTDMAGMFRQYRFDITDYINRDSKNYLAVKIYPLDYPGLPAPAQLKALGPFYANGGPTGDIGKNVTMLCSIGWDWMPAVRDREMGIWQPVYISTSGPVTIDEPHIVTKLPDLPDTSRAGLNISMRLDNHSSHSQDGKLNLKITPENFKGKPIQFSSSQKISANQTKEVTLNYQDISQLNIKNPRLWWPNGYGRPNLYNLELVYSVDGRISYRKKITFGIRTVSSQVTDVEGWPRRDFYVNGRNIKLTGGAWVPDLLLQRDSLRYEQEMSLIENANLNTVRIWGGGIAPPDEFYNQADRHGLLVWQDFWITGDTNGEFKGSADWPLQGDVYIKNMKNTIKRVRNHPSLLVWTGGNEGHARKELYDAMRHNVAELDGTRPFIPSSSGFAKLPKGWTGSWPDNNKGGVYSGGPYSWQKPSHYYDLVDAGKDWVWKDEVGMPSQPAYSSLPKIVPNLVPDTTEPFPLNDTWGYHDAASGNGKYDTYYKAIVDRYGPPKSYKDYSAKAQLANADGYRAIFESVGSKLQDTGGVLLWKLNAAWPSVVWQIYDWYLNPNAGYYFTKRAVEPVHIQFNLDDSTLAVVNRRFKDQDGLKARVRFYGKDMRGKFD